MDFSEEAGIELAEDECIMMEEKNAIRILLISEKVEEAIQKIDNIDPQHLENNDELLLDLRLKQFLILLKAKKLKEAVEFSKKYSELESSTIIIVPL